jgi:GGDEF domain-containing protein
MRIFDKIDPNALEKRETQLWILALVLMTVMAVGLAWLMYPAAFYSAVPLSKITQQRAFLGFCALAVLGIGYLIERHFTVRSLRRRLLEELRQNVELRTQASDDLLSSLPGRDRFRDQLAMEFRRSETTRESLSVLTVRLSPSAQLTSREETTVAFGDAAKVAIRRLRREDSIYQLHPGAFAMILPAAGRAQACRVADRISEGLRDASGASDRYCFDVRVFNYPEHTVSASELEQMVGFALGQKCERGGEIPQEQAVGAASAAA